MNKKILTLAFISAALFLSCSADDFFDPSKDVPDPGGIDPGPGTGPGGDGKGSCEIMGYCSKDNVTESECETMSSGLGTFNPGGTCD
jgi:hypothetical protein